MPNSFTDHFGHQWTVTSCLCTTLTQRKWAVMFRLFELQELHRWGTCVLINFLPHKTDEWNWICLWYGWNFLWLLSPLLVCRLEAESFEVGSDQSTWKSRTLPNQLEPIEPNKPAVGWIQMLLKFITLHVIYSYIS